jgi:hypothetical protein
VIIRLPGGGVPLAVFGAKTRVPLSAQLRAARQHTMRTIANVMAYAWLVLQTPPGSREAPVLEAIAPDRPSSVS